MRHFGIAFSLLAAILCVAIVLPSAASVDASIETKTGFLIPSQCKPEEGVKPEPKGATDAWPAPHTTACSLEPACIASGYGLWVEDRFFRLDDEGQRQALEYFQTTKRTSYNKVELTGDFRDPQAVVVTRIELTD